MSETQKLLIEIEAFLAQTGMAESTFGRKAVNDGKLTARLRGEGSIRGKGSVTLEKAVQIRRFIAEASRVPA
ncbi:hypothetical protein [Bosea vaviloviae]|uniref:Uncharacterized protein n=1 Tax=Bosea vaviloviae TaxID=1526658 RepID=A0A0N1F4T2_9HYPH|nr:hypothetical protein [Bosea vaviloviae]KPH79349.1 hypothetical protein AE618_18805 [Bosea vaviloviae]